ncbi:MAG: TIGR00282 family metallophosphoesterase [Candidatus Delongbacteria bacterium]|nr:TIGR00282 family metallophosphoesterase [Candidatus Delongbacteria bacterium]
MPSNIINVLFIADIVGRIGRRLIVEKLESIKKEENITFVIANGENAAGGIGLTSDIAYHLFQAGVDIITSGNHIWEKHDIYPVLEKEARLLRPYNYPERVLGHGYSFIERTCMTLAVINLEGRTFMRTIECPFQALERLLPIIKKKTDVILIDFHAECTAEKKSFAYYFDGQVTAIIGTHTHVQTADEQLLPGGTAYITDAGMTGAHKSVIGFEIPSSIYRFLTQMPAKLNPAREDPRIEGVIISIDSQTSKPVSIRRYQYIKELTNITFSG